MEKSQMIYCHMKVMRCGGYYLLANPNSYALVLRCNRCMFESYFNVTLTWSH